MNPANLRATGPARHAGYTMVELVMVLLTIAIFAAFALMSYQGTSESRDAAVVQSAQSTLQSIISQGSVRMDTRPDQLDPAAVVLAMEHSFNESGNTTPQVAFETAGNGYRIRILSSNRGAVYSIAPTGDVLLNNLENFVNYGVQNGVIAKR